LRRFQTGPGFYNSLAPPFLDRYKLDPCGAILVSAYPIVEFDYVDEYEGRKLSEKVAPYLQRQKATDLPSISQWRYSRRFDLVEDIPAAVDVFRQDSAPESIQTSRGLYEYSFPEFETLHLDKKQTVVRQQQMKKSYQPLQLLVIDSLWLVAFPEKGKIYLSNLTVFLEPTDLLKVFFSHFAMLQSMRSACTRMLKVARPSRTSSDWWQNSLTKLTARCLLTSLFIVNTLLGWYWTLKLSRAHS
jgi:hypothetical protein